MEAFLEFLKVVFFGKSGPGLGAEPLVLVAWLCVPGLLQLARVYAGRDRDAPAVLLTILALFLAGSLIFTGYTRTSPTQQPGKMAAPEPRHEAPDIIATDPPAVPTFELHQGGTMIGGDLRSGLSLSSQSLTIESCQDACAKAGDCKAFTFDGTDRSCHLKGAVTTRHSLAGATTGIKKPESAGRR